jgi:ribokinase
MRKLVNLGSLCIDSVYSVPNLAHAGETVASLGCNTFPGGKGLNQSIAAAYAGCEVVHIGAVGDDGDLLLDVLRDANVDIADIVRLPGQSGHAVIQVDASGQNAIVISGGTNRSLDRAVFDRAFERLEADDWLLLQNEINDVDAAIREANAAGRRVALNLAPVDERIGVYPLDLLDLLIVNELEAMAAAGTADLDAAFVALEEKLPNTSVVLTEGARGLRYIDRTTRSKGTLGSFKVEPVDETGAGDCFVGYLMAGLVKGAELPLVLNEASAAGALACTANGAATAIPARDAVEALLQAQPLIPSP